MLTSKQGAVDSTARRLRSSPLPSCAGKSGSGHFPDRRHRDGSEEPNRSVLVFVAGPFGSVHPPMMTLFILIKLLLLFRCEERTDLRHSAAYDRFHFLHALAMDRSDLRPGLIEDWLNLGPLIWRQVQPFGYFFKPMPSAAATTVAALCLHNGKAANSN